MVAFNVDGLTRERPLREFGVFSKDRLVGPNAADVLGGRLALFLKNAVPRVDRRGIRLLNSLVTRSVGLDIASGFFRGLRSLGLIATSERRRYEVDDSVKW